MSADIQYNLSYFRPGEKSSVDITLDTEGSAVHGFQLVLSVVGNPSLTIVDGSPKIDGLQLDSFNSPELNVITNKITQTADGYQVVLAAITKNPQKPFVSDGRQVVAKLLFKQATPGTLEISEEGSLTKISTASKQGSSSEVGGSQTSGVVATQTAPPTPTANRENRTVLLDTQPAGTTLDSLGGTLFIPPAEENEPYPGLVSSAVERVFPESETFFSSKPGYFFDILLGLFVGAVVVLTILFLRKRKNKSSHHAVATMSTMTGASVPSSQPVVNQTPPTVLPAAAVTPPAAAHFPGPASPDPANSAPVVTTTITLPPQQDAGLPPGQKPST